MYHFLLGLIVILLLFSVLLYGLQRSGAGDKTKEDKRAKVIGEGLDRYHKELQSTKENRKLEILELFKTNKELTNNNIEKLLGVSDATTTRYLDELEEEGIVETFGNSRRTTKYRLKNK